MNKRVGTYVTQKVSGEPYKTYVPPKLPQVSVQLLSTELGMTPPTARNTLNHMTHLGILEEMSGKKEIKFMSTETISLF